MCENAVEQTSSIPWLEKPRAAEYLWDARQYAQEAALPGGVSPEKRRRRGGAAAATPTRPEEHSRCNVWKVESSRRSWDGPTRMSTGSRRAKPKSAIARETGEEAPANRSRKRRLGGQVETPEVTQPRGWCEPKRVGTLQSHGGGLKHRQRTPEPVPEAEGVRIETDPGAWSLQVQAKPEAESQQEVPTCSGG